MKKFLWLIVILLIPAKVFAQEDDGFSLKDALSKIKKPAPPMSVEARLNENEIICRYKNFSADYNRLGKQKNLTYIKLNYSKEIIALMGSGIDWSCGASGIYWKDGAANFKAVPTLGIDLYVTIMPKTKIYTQFSGMPVGGWGRIYDAESGVRYSPSKNLSWTAGYRHLSAKFKQFNFKESGFFVGVRTDF